MVERILTACSRPQVQSPEGHLHWGTGCQGSGSPDRKPGWKTVRTHIVFQLGISSLSLFTCLSPWDRVSGSPGTHSVDQIGLELKRSTCLASQVPGLKAVPPEPGNTLQFVFCCCFFKPGIDMVLFHPAPSLLSAFTNLCFPLCVCFDASFLSHVWDPILEKMC